MIDLKKEEEVQKEENQWHLDKKVPVAMILALIGQMIVGTIWISDAVSDLKNVKVDVSKLERRLDDGEARDKIFADMIPRLEERQKQTNDLLEKIWRRLESGK